LGGWTDRCQVFEMADRPRLDVFWDADSGVEQTKRNARRHDMYLKLRGFYNVQDSRFGPLVSETIVKLVFVLSLILNRVRIHTELQQSPRLCISYHINLQP
jgi:hypothetical protein